MKASVAFLLCFVAGSALGYYVQREAPYNQGPNDPYAVQGNPNYIQEPSQRLFWGNNGAGSNQVGGTGLWATITNKFPFLGTMFGRMEQYGVPAQYETPSYQFYQSPPQFYPQQYYPQQFSGQQFSGQQFQGGRDVGFTDDAVIITPPQVPAFPPRPVQPAPAPEPQPGYRYDRPPSQYRLELPHK